MDRKPGTTVRFQKQKHQTMKEAITSSMETMKFKKIPDYTMWLNPVHLLDMGDEPWYYDKVPKDEIWMEPK